MYSLGPEGTCGLREQSKSLVWDFIGFLCKPTNINLFFSSIFLSAEFFLYLSLNLFTDAVSPEGTPGSCGGWTLASGAQTGTQKDSSSPVWIADRLSRHVTVSQTSSSPIASTTKKKKDVPQPPPPPPT